MAKTEMRADRLAWARIFISRLQSLLIGISASSNYHALPFVAFWAFSASAQASNGLADGGFDAQGASVSTYCYMGTSGCPTGSWSGAGAALVQTGWSNPPAQSPSTLIALQDGGSVKQTFTATTSGNFRVVWYQADRPSLGGQTFNVWMNNTPVATATPSSTAFVRNQSGVFPMTADTSYTIIFQGTQTSGDHSAFIDSVDVLPATDAASYTYDALGRLTNVARSGAAYGGVTSNYTFDAAGNRSNVTVTGASH